MFIALVVLLAIFDGSLAQVMSNQSCITQPCTLGTSYVDIALVIDTSRSINRAYFDAIKAFINLWASDYSIGPNPQQVQFGFVTYGLWGASYGTFSTASMNYPNLTSVVNDLAYQGYADRNMFDALTKVANNLIASDANSGWRSSSKHLMVVFTGDSFTGPDTWKDVATQLRGQFDRVVAVGLTQNAVLNQYRQLVELVGGDASNIFLIGGPSGLKYIIPWLEYQACNVSGSGSSDPCANYSCGANGICVTNGLFPECKCNPCWTGPRCSIMEPNPCDTFGNLCGDHGTCMFNQTTCKNPYCNCTDGYTGDICSDAGTTASTFRSYKLYDVPNRGK